MKKKVASAVKSAYPSIEVTKKATESKEEKKAPKKLDERTDSAFCLAQELLGLNESVDDMDEIKVGSHVHIMSKVGMCVMHESVEVFKVTGKGVEVTGNEAEVDQEWYSFDTCHIYPV